MPIILVAVEQLTRFVCFFVTAFLFIFKINTVPAIYFNKLSVYFGIMLYKISTVFTYVFCFHNSVIAHTL